MRKTASWLFCFRKNYPCDKPILHFAGTSALQSGFDLMILEYGYQAARTDLDVNELQRVIEDSHESVQRIISKYKQVVFISKSIGTIVAGEVHGNSKFQSNIYF